MQPVEETEVDGVDYGWVMQVTFVLTILLGAPVVALLSTAVTLDSWPARAGFAVRVGAPIWFLTAVVTYAYAKRNDVADDSQGHNGNGDGGPNDADDPERGPNDEF